MRTESGREIVSSRGIFILKRFFADWVVVSFWQYSSGANFSYIFFWGKFLGGNAAENFLPKNVGKKMEFSAEKVLKKSLFQEIP
jgi:hypothetical protein